MALRIVSIWCNYTTASSYTNRLFYVVFKSEARKKPTPILYFWLFFFSSVKSGSSAVKWGNHKGGSQSFQSQSQNYSPIDPYVAI